MPEKSKLFQFNLKHKPFFQKISVISAFVIACNLIAGIGFFVNHSSKPEVLGVVSGKDGYKLRYSKTTNGALIFAGNSLCLSDDQPQGTCGTFITTDISSSDTPYKAGTTSDWTKNSSTGMLKIPAGSEILYAELIWGGSYKYKDLDLTNKLDLPVNLMTPKGSYKITPDSSTSAQVSESSAYVRTANVTDIIGKDGSGIYTAGSIPASMDRTNPYNNYAGWTLAIAYRDLKQPPRNLSIFVGSEQAGPDQLSNVAEVKGFATPTNGNISGKLLVSAQEGDPCYSGDQMRFGQTQTSLTALSGPNNQKDNFFAAKINDSDGKIDTSGSFGSSNQPSSTCANAKRQGWDIANVDISSLLKTNQTSAYAQGYSTGDVYMINALGMQIDVNAAKPAIVLKVDKTEAKIGDILTYTMNISNSGTANSDNTILKGLIPDQTSFVADSLIIDGKAITGSDATTNLGTVKPGQVIEAIYKAKVTDAPSTGKFVNIASIDYEYTMVKGDQPITDVTKSNEVITVYSQNPNLPPVAVDDQAQTEQGKLVSIDVLNNDNDPDGNLEPNTLNITKNPDNGIFMIVNGKVNYTPKDTFTGVDNFEYKICDSKQLCDKAKVTITVNPKQVEDKAPIAAPDTASTALDTPVLIDILKNDTYSNQNPNNAKLSTVTPPSNGQVTYDQNGKANYIPKSGFSGQDTFEYKLCDNTSLCASAKVTITIKAPENLNLPPVALDDQAKTKKNTPVTIDVLKNDSDANGNLNPDSLIVTKAPVGGKTEKINNQMLYTPNQDFAGSDSFEYKVCDTALVCAVANVKLEVIAENIVTPPPAQDSTAEAVQDNAKTQTNKPVKIAVLDNDKTSSSLDKNSLKIKTQPSNGMVTPNTDGTLIYTPKTDYNGPDSLKYEICNTEKICSEANVNITIEAATVIVLPSTPKPIAKDDSVQTSLGNKVLIPVLQNDSAPDDKLDPASLKITQNANFGNVIVDLKTGEVNYLPNPNFKDGDNFKYQICNTKGGCAIASVTISSKPIAQSSTSGTTISLPTIDKTAPVSTPAESPKTTPIEPQAKVEGVESVTNNPTTDLAVVDTTTTRITDAQSDIIPAKKPGQVLGIGEIRQQLVRTGGEFGLNVFLPLNIGLIVIIFVMNKFTQKQEDQQS